MLSAFLGLPFLVLTLFVLGSGAVLREALSDDDAAQAVGALVVGLLLIAVIVGYAYALEDLMAQATACEVRP